MAQEKIGLNYGLAKAVWQDLERRGIPMRKDPVGLMDCRFTKEELAMVKSITLADNSFGIKGISHLENLESLTITTSQRTAYTPRSQLISIEDRDVFEIEKLSKLKHLEISNQRLITSIDITNFPNLQTLTLTRNEELESIYGLGQNRSLYSLTVYDSNNLQRIADLDKFVEQNQNLEDLNLDVLMYPWAIGYNPRNGSINQNALDKITKDIPYATWTETITRRDIKINNHQMAEMHKIALDAVTKYCPRNVSDIETIAGVDRWLSRNVKYNYDALGTKLRAQSKDGIVYGPIGGVNGAYNAFKYNSCVCEGYTRAMQYMLGLRGIRTSNTHCIAEKDTLHLSEKENDTPYRFVQLPKDGY
ncbi:MAG: leucine-rich repeat domain-containing protein, partial [Clostridia bacterium]|nr:leucine-rich repeat domain-containing protein [Clostridia bacterium]